MRLVRAATVLKCLPGGWVSGVSFGLLLKHLSEIAIIRKFLLCKIASYNGK